MDSAAIKHLQGVTGVITSNARTILQKRYLAPGESIDDLWNRVSGGNEKFRRLLSELRFLPNSPTLFNAGLNNGCTLSACFVFDVSDTMLDDDNGIHNTRGKAIAVAKAGGGVGYYLGNLRPKNSIIRSIHRKACGPVSVLRDYHGVRQLITQGGKRDLAQMAILNCDHSDIKEFIHCKDADPKSLESFNISVGWHSEFAKRALHYLAGNSPNPSDREWANLWTEQVQSAWTHGCPGMFFPGRVNDAQGNPNMHLGVINAANPCGETPNRNNEPCSLGSLVLSRYYNHANRDIDWNALEEDAWMATQFMDDILDRNTFPHPAITDAALLTRKLGLGVMGWADLLALLHVPYDSEEAITLGGKVMRFINDIALASSVDLAKTKGPYKGYSDKTQGPLCRNETRTSIAPTGTIAIIAGCDSWSIEPHYGLDVQRTTNEGIKMEERFDSRKYDGFVPKTANDIHWSWHVRMQAAFQEHTDLGVSKTVNLPNKATKEDVSKAYQMMFELGCKGGTVYRDGCRAEQVLVNKATSVYALGGVPPLPSRRRLPDQCKAMRKKFSIGGVEGYIHAGTYEDGTLGEIFVTTCMGSTIDGLLDTWAKAFSNALQHGTPLEQLIRMHRNQRFEPSGPTGDPDTPVCTSIPDYVVRYLERMFLKRTPRVPANGNGREVVVDVRDQQDSGIYCPECQRSLIYQGGCVVCPDKECGWTRCG